MTRDKILSFDHISHGSMYEDDDQYQNQLKEDKENDIPGWHEDRLRHNQFPQWSQCYPLHPDLGIGLCISRPLQPNSKQCIHETHKVRCLRTNK